MRVRVRVRVRVRMRVCECQGRLRQEGKGGEWRNGRRGKARQGKQEMEDGRGGKQEEQEKQDEQDEQGAKGGDLVRHRQVGPPEAVERDRLWDLDGSATEDEILRGTQLDAVHRIGGQRGEGAEEAIAPAASRGGPESAQLRSHDSS